MWLSAGGKIVQCAIGPIKGEGAEKSWPWTWTTDWVREQRTEYVNLQLGSQSNDRKDKFADQEIVVALLLLSVNASSCSIRC